METMYTNRLERVLRNMERMGLDALIVSDPKSIWYLCGVNVAPYERMFALYLERAGTSAHGVAASAGGTPPASGASQAGTTSTGAVPLTGTLFANRLFSVAPHQFETVWYTDTDDPVNLLAARACSTGTVGVDKDWPARFLLPLMAQKPAVRFVPGSDCVDDERGCKDAAEIAIMKEASRINDLCMERGMAFVHEGVTEKEVASYIEEQFLAEGAAGPSFETIVSFGKNAADPHHTPDDTVVQDGDCVLIDMGCVKDRYCSDMTRTRYFKRVSDEDREIHDIVREANEAAEALVKPGVPLCELDKAARDLITKAGYGEFFTHRLGHFIGQGEHEKGDVSATNDTPARPGMIFSIEPGIYLPGKTGVRIEDLVLVTETGCEVLNRVDKTCAIVGGSGGNDE